MMDDDIDWGEAILNKHATPLQKHEFNRPKFYLIDLNNYTSEFLGEIIQWQHEKIEHLEKELKNNKGRVMGV